MNEKSRFRILYIADSQTDSQDEERRRHTQHLELALNQIGYPYRLVVTSDDTAWHEGSVQNDADRVAGAQDVDVRDMDCYDLIVLDQVTPTYRGLDLLRRWRALENRTPVLLLTAFTEPSLLHAAKDLDVVQVIIKDAAQFYVQNIPAAVEQIMGVRGASNELVEAAQRAQRLNRSLILLNRVGQLLTSTLDLEQVTVRFVETTAKLINTEGSTVWLFEEGDSGHLVCAAAYSSGSHVPPDTLKLPPGEGIAGWVAAHGEDVLITDAWRDARFSARVDNTLNFQTHSLLTVPLRTRNEIIGVLQLVNKRRGEFDEDDRSLAETLAASAAIAIANARLLDELRQRNRELELQNADLDAYSDTVAHDLKNPITHFLSYADDLRENYTEMSAEEIEGHLEIILQQSKRMNAIIEELLLLARVRMTHDLDVRALEMDEIVHDALARLAPEIQHYEAEITVADAWPQAQGYAPWIEGVWYNYISNGLKYGGEPPVLELGGRVHDDATAHFWIRDHGDGLTPDEQAKLFAPFPKLDHPRRKGHGLGLVIVKRIIERLGGQVWVESQAGRGSTFYFSLPRA